MSNGPILLARVSEELVEHIKQAVAHEFGITITALPADALKLSYHLRTGARLSLKVIYQIQYFIKGLTYK